MLAIKASTDSMVSTRLQYASNENVCKDLKESTSERLLLIYLSILLQKLRQVYKHKLRRGVKYLITLILVLVPPVPMVKRVLIRVTLR